MRATNRNVKNTAILLVALLMITGFSYAQEFNHEQERELAKAAFKSLQDADLETFTSYCATNDRLAKMLSDMPEETPKEISIKDELSDMEADELKSESISGFNAALELAKTDNVDLKDGEFPELGTYKVRFEVTNLKCTKVSFDISPEKKYLVIINMFNTKDDIFIYDFRMIKGGVH